MLAVLSFTSSLNTHTHMCAHSTHMHTVSHTPFAYIHTIIDEFIDVSPIPSKSNFTW